MLYSKNAIKDLLQRYVKISLKSVRKTQNVEYTK